MTARARELAKKAYALATPGSSTPKDRSPDIITGWLFETLYDYYAQALKVDRVLFASNTGQQDIRIVENARFGRCLILDGVVQTTEADEFVYHEMLTHVPILAHGAAKSILIIGGGDGGIAREAAKHANIDRITMVEIDKGVVEFSKLHLPNLSLGAFDDPRFELVIEDGAKYVARPVKPFDVIVVDRTDPFGPGAALYSKTFYENCRRLLTPDGILVAQNGVPFQQAEELGDTMADFRQVFKDWTCYIATVPSYCGGPMALSWGANSSKARKIDLETLTARFNAASLKTYYYTPEVHKAAFALPRYIADILPRE